MAQERPDVEEWLGAGQAAEVLGLTAGHVVRLGRWGRLPMKRTSEGQALFAADAVHQAAADRHRWVSQDEAAAIVGCSRYLIVQAIKAGHLEVREAGRRASVDRASAEQYAVRWREERAKAARRRARARREQRKRAAAEAPPDDGDVWLDTATTAAILRVSPNRVKQLAAADRIPHVRKGRRVWFRRAHVEQLAAARTMQQLQRAERSRRRDQPSRRLEDG